MHLEEGKAKPQRQLRNEAIALAMQSRWEEAAEMNKNIIEAFPMDVDAYNQLGRALMELGRFADAKEAYGKALELQPNNAIARKICFMEMLLRKRLTYMITEPQPRGYRFLQRQGSAVE